MNESDARRTLLVRAFETPIAAPWTDGDAAWAGREAARLEGESASAERLIAQRARLASERLGERAPALRKLLGALDQPARLGWWLLPAVLVAGLLIDEIGPSQRINILAPPLLALLAWNLAVYAALAIGALRFRAGTPAGVAIVRRALTWLAGRVGSAPAREAGDGALARFVADWTHAARQLDAARIAALLHAAAAAIALGVLASMYLRGLAFEYRAGWDSTFVTPATVQRLLAIALGPASQLSGIALPDANELAALRFSAGPGENAARWIHLHAITVALVVLLPRAALAARSAWRARRLARDFPLALDEPYFQRLVREQADEPVSVWAVPYSYRLAPERVAGLRTALQRSLGPRIELRLAEPVSWGHDDGLPAAPAKSDHVVALFAATATPERESHGEFLQALGAAAGAPLSVWVDESALRLRFAGTTRLEQRREAWTRFLRDTGRTPQFVDLSAP